MHIAHFTNTYHPVISGVVRSVSAFRKALTGLGHNVFIFAHETGDYEDTAPFIFRYPALKLSSSVDFPATLPISPFVDKLLPYLKLDVIHAHHPFLLGRTAASKARELNLPLIFTFHTRYREYAHYFPLPQEMVQDFVKDAIDSWLGEYMQKCHHIIAPTESMREILMSEYGLLERVTAVPTGIDLRPYQDTDREVVRALRGWGDEKVLVSVGRLALEKNWTTLLDAGARVMQTHKNLRIVLIGDGPARGSLQKYVRELGIAERVTFAGKLPFDDIPYYLKAADIFGFASVTETQGLATMEALAAGLPVVAVNATGTRDVVEHGREGLLTENDSTALSAALQQILEDENLLRSYQEAAIRKAQCFDITHQAKRLEGVYHQAIEDKKAGRTVMVRKLKKLFNLKEIRL
ncbi:MAG: glycosyltransferase [Anaerolineales bacterium]